MSRLPLLLAILALLLGGCQQAPATGGWDPDSGAGRPARTELPVRGEAQHRSLSCESRSSADLLGWYGIAVTEEVFFAGLPRSDNPHFGFVGDVDGPGEQLPPSGYGVYAEPIATRLRELGLPARARSGATLEWVKDEIAQGRPVIVWAPGTLQVRPRVTLTDGRGRTYVAVRGEHTFIAVGYAPGQVQVLDAANGRIKWVFDRQFDAAWATLGRMAVSVDPGRNGTPR